MKSRNCESVIVKYQAVHAYELFYQQVQESGLILTDLGDWKNAARRWENTGPAYTLIVDGRVISCIGIAMADKSFGECWAFIPGHNSGLRIARFIKKALAKACSEITFRRLQAYVQCEFTGGVKLVEYLGFKKEGVARKYGPHGEDMILYSKVF